jgi:hypothetical protein
MKVEERDTRYDTQIQQYIEHTKFFDYPLLLSDLGFRLVGSRLTFRYRLDTFPRFSG